MTDTADVPAGLVAAAFGLGEPTGPLRPVRHVSQETWRLDTSTGSALVKRFWTGPEVPWRAELERAMALERRALEVGVDGPHPIPPPEPQFGEAAHIPGHGVFRAYPYLTEHRPYDPERDLDDVAEWVGTTLATIHRLEAPLAAPPEPNWWYNQFPPVEEDEWRRWLTEATDRALVWAKPLAERLPLILDLSSRLPETFAAGAPHVLTHRDFEPWNVLMVPDGTGWKPMLIDWDVAGPDSAPLEAAHVLTTFAKGAAGTPDARLVGRMLRAYIAAGGPAPIADRGLLLRLVGTRLARMSARIRTELDGAELASVDPHKAAAELVERLETLPTMVADTTAWAELFG